MPPRIDSPWTNSEDFRREVERVIQRAQSADEAERILRDLSVIVVWAYDLGNNHFFIRVIQYPGANNIDMTMRVYRPLRFS